jgi:hypothetical protein
MGIHRKLYLLAGGAIAAEVVAYLLWRSRMLGWGATAEEASEPLPGDDRTPHPRVQSTRAVTIGAPPEQVWPWLLQMGIGRAGFYTHDWWAGTLSRRCWPGLLSVGSSWYYRSLSNPEACSSPALVRLRCYPFSSCAVHLFTAAATFGQKSHNRRGPLGQVANVSSSWWFTLATAR